MKIARRDTSRRPSKPEEHAPVGLGNLPDGDWVTVEVEHLPAPQGSHRQGFGKSVRETNPRTQPYREAVAKACAPMLLDGPLEAQYVFRLMPAPKSDPHREFHTTPPDLDKLERATNDGLKMGKLIADDARISLVTYSEKVHASTELETGATIRVRRRRSSGPA